MGQDFFASILNKKEPETYAEKCELLLEKGYSVDFSQALSKAFSLFGQNAGAFIGYSIIYLLINGVLSVIPVIGSVTQMFVLAPLMAGFYIVGRSVQTGSYSGFSQFFEGFNHFIQLLVQNLIMYSFLMAAILVMLVPIGVLVALGVIGQGLSPESMLSPAVFGLTLLLAIPILYVICIYMLAPHFVIFAKMTAWQAMEMSRKLVHKSFGTFIGIFFALILIAFLGVLFFGIGIIVALPIIMLLLYAVFDQIVGTYEN